MADGGTITAADTGNPADNSDSGIDPTTGQPQTQGFKAWFKQHETLSLVIGAGVLLLTAILVFRKNQSATPSGDLSGQATDTSGQTDNSGALAAAINALLNYLGSHSGDQQPTGNPPNPPTPPPPPSPPIPTSPPVPVPHPGPPVPPTKKPPPGGRLPPPSGPPPGGRPPPGRQPPPGKGGTGDSVISSDPYNVDYPTVAQWTPDSAPIQHTFSNVTQGETSPVTRIENLFAGLFDGVSGPGGVNVPFPGPEPTGMPRSPWQPVPLGVPFSVPVSPDSGPGTGTPGSSPPQGPTPGSAPPRFRRMPWQRVP